MIRVIEGMPAGTVGVEAVGKVTEADYCGPAMSSDGRRSPSCPTRRSG